MNLALAYPLPAPAPAPEQGIEIAVRELEVSYRRRGTVFSQVSFEIRRGDRVSLVGSNGAGKSTLLKALLGFVAPSAGSINVLGQQLSVSDTRALRELRASIGFVAQKHNLVPRLSVLSNVVHGTLGGRPGPFRWFHGIAPDEVRRRALAALDRVGLAHLALQRADSLSGGQSQRVAIARALVSEPRLILADEPVASLDPAAGEDVMQVFEEVVRAEGATLIFTTHSLDHATRYADRVLGLCHGTLRIDSASHALAAGEIRALYG